MTIQPICAGCNTTPENLDEYIEQVEEENKIYDETSEAEREELGLIRFESPSDYVRQFEGTYNPENGHFLCTDCYIKAGMPSSSQGWIAP